MQKSKNLKNILVIDYFTSTFNNNAGSNRSYQLLKIYGELGNRVIYIGTPLIYIPNILRLKELKKINVNTIYMPLIFSVPRFLKKYGLYFDIVIISRDPIAKKYFSSIKKYCFKAKIIFDTVDLHYVRELRKAMIEKNASIVKQAKNTKKRELFFSSNSDATFVVSDIEKKILLKESPYSKNIVTIPTIHYVRKPLVPYKNRSDIMFLGYFGHDPNVDAVHFFVKEVYPKLFNHYPNLKVYIIGRNAPFEIRRYQSKKIIFTNYVPDLTVYFDICKFLIAPLRYGAGVKGKIGDAMANGLPVITTSIGAEGMYLTDNFNAIIADGANNIAKRLCENYNDEQKWNFLSINGMKHINHHFSYTVAKNKISELLKAL